jgi:hypothetical protein
MDQLQRVLIDHVLKSAIVALYFLTYVLFWLDNRYSSIIRHAVYKKSYRFYVNTISKLVWSPLVV